MFLIHNFTKQLIFSEIVGHAETEQELHPPHSGLHEAPVKLRGGSVRREDNKYCHTKPHVNHCHEEHRQISCETVI